MTTGLEYTADIPESSAEDIPSPTEPGFSRRVLQSVAHDRTLLLVTAIFAILILLAVFGPVVWRADAVNVNLDQTLQSPSLQHPFGTDEIGRDVLARFMSGARISLEVGIVVVIVGAIVGGLVGLIAGALGAWIDNVLMRIMDALLSFPPLILAMMVTVGLGVGLQTAALGIILTSVPYYARILRSEVLKVRSLDFIQGAIALGASQRRIMFRHILPNSISTVLVQASAIFGYSILTLAALGFVGLGAQIPTPEWGTMITEGQSYFLTGKWWIGVFPGIGLLVAVTAANLLADRLRDVLDPRGGYS
ncbi:MAG: ABC transporter permease [Chloroflexota bacterium]